jgi:hypothetical protein
MNKNNRTRLASLIFIALSGCGNNEAEQKVVAAHTAANKARAAEWAVIAKTKDISPSETIKLIRIPDDSGHKLFDSYCFVYTNSALKTSNITCPQDYRYEEDQADPGGDQRENGFSRYD